MNKLKRVNISHQENSSAVSLITNLVVSVPYLIYIFLRYQNENLNSSQELSFWASAILLLIPIKIIAEIIIFIVFSIIRMIVTQEKEGSLIDERDKLIKLKATRNSTFLFAFGFLLSMVAAVISKSLSVMFIFIFISGFLAELVGSISQIYYYRRGL